VEFGNFEILFIVPADQLLYLLGICSVADKQCIGRIYHNEVIEVQLGEYLKEDDIVRFEDDYGRTGI
jgi:hypothetical protein